MIGIRSQGEAQQTLSFSNEKVYLNKVFPDRYSKSYIFPSEFPQFNPQDQGKPAEQHVYKILTQIDEPMIVIYSFEGCDTKMFETDFLIIHKERGIMLFEVKSSTKKRGTFGNAFKQVKNHASQIKRKLEKEIKVKKKDVRYAVAMPNCSCPEQYSGDCVYKESLASKEGFEEWIKEFRPTNGRELSDNEYDRCLEFFLEQLPIVMNSIYERLNKLTPAQARLLNGVPDEFYIAGPAGSGKTEVMIYRAAEEKLHQQRKLIVVYHEALSNYLKWRLNGTPKLDILVFGKLLEVLTKNLIRNTAMEQYSNKDLIDVAIRILCLEPSSEMQWDSIFVDEAQDMEGENWETLIDMLHNKRKGHLKLIFFDSNQMLTSSTDPPNPEGYQIYHLTEVIRNTKNIFKKSLPFYFCEKESTVQHNCDGPEVIWNTSFTDSDVDSFSSRVLDYIHSCVEEMWKELQEVRPMDICILVEAGRAEDLRQNILQCEISNVHPFNVNEMIHFLKIKSWPTDMISLNRCGVTVDAVSNYKGLGSKAVILLINRNRVPNMLIENMYEGITRCCCKLVVILSKKGHQHLERELEKKGGTLFPMDADKPMVTLSDDKTSEVERKVEPIDIDHYYDDDDMEVEN